MAKLHFRYSAMNAGKSLDLISTDFNYKELGKHTLVLIPAIVGKDVVQSRTGLEVPALPISKGFNIYSYILKYFLEFDIKVDCILVDEAQFLTKDQVRQLRDVTVNMDIPVICYGLRTDFMGEPFEGATFLMAWADELEEKITLCFCGKKARMNLKSVNGQVVDYGQQVEINGVNQKVKYHSVCKEHFLRKEIGR